MPIELLGVEDPLAVFGTFSSPLTNKGDLLAFSTVSDRFPVGANGSLVTADSTQTFGLRYVTYPVLSGLAGVSYVNTLATGGTGTSIDPWTGWETAVNALIAGSRIHFPRGFYRLTTIITIKEGQLVSGDGKDYTLGSVVTSSIAGTAFRTAFTINNSNRANVSVFDLAIINTNGANTGSGFLEVAGSYVVFFNVAIQGFRYNLTCNQTEISQFLFCNFEFALRAGVWLVNNGEYNLTFADIDLSAAGGARTTFLKFQGCQFNQNAGVACVINDGGETHEFSSCNFNGGTYGVIAAGISPLDINHCQFEGQSLEPITLTNISFNGGASSGIGPCGQVILDRNLAIQTTAGKHAVKCVSGPDTLSLFNSVLQPQTGAAIIGCVNVNTIVNFGSQNPVSLGFGQLYDVLPTRIIDLTRSGFTLGNVPFKMISAAGVLRCGTNTLSVGTFSIANTSVTANTEVDITRKTQGGAPGFLSYVVTPGVGVVVTSSSGTDNGAFFWKFTETA